MWNDYCHDERTNNLSIMYIDSRNPELSWPNNSDSTLKKARGINAKAYCGPVLDQIGTCVMRAAA